MNSDDEVPYWQQELAKENFLEQELNPKIDSYLFKTYKKIEKQLKEDFPDKSEAELKRLVKDLYKEKYDNEETTKTKKSLFLPIFSSSPNCWFHDIFDNGAGSKPRYWHIFLGVNNHYARAYKLENRSAGSIKSVLEKFISEYRPLKLTSDKERGFIDRNVQNFIKSKHCQAAYINAGYSDHVGLGTLDRFCRTIRDMNHKLINNRLKKPIYSDDPIREPITTNAMALIIKVYNNTYHFRIKMSPQEMMDNPTLETEYIWNHLRKKEEVEYEGVIPEGAFVRTRTPKNKFKKRREQVTAAGKIVGKKGGRYIVEAEDGTTKLFTRQQLVLMNSQGKSDFAKQIAHFAPEGKPGRKKKEVKSIPVIIEKPMKTRSQTKYMLTRSQAKKNKK